MVVWVDGGTRLVLSHLEAAPFGDGKQTSRVLRPSRPTVTSLHASINRSHDILTEQPRTATRGCNLPSLRTVTATAEVAELRALQNKGRCEIKFAEILPSRVERRTRLVTRARESALAVHGRQAKETGQDPTE